MAPWVLQSIAGNYNILSNMFTKIRLWNKYVEMCVKIYIVIISLEVPICSRLQLLVSLCGYWIMVLVYAKFNILSETCNVN